MTAKELLPRLPEGVRGVSCYQHLEEESRVQNSTVSSAATLMNGHRQGNKSPHGSSPALCFSTSALFCHIQPASKGNGSVKITHRSQHPGQEARVESECVA